jgi:hypothetical protein
MEMQIQAILLLGLSLILIDRTAAFSAPISSPKIVYQATAAAPMAGRFEIQNLPDGWQQKLDAEDNLKAAWKIHSDGNSGLFGSVGRSSSTIWFQPRFPLQPEVAYQVEFFHKSVSASPLRFELKIPRLKQARTEVMQIWPSAKSIPENTLRFYVYFSAKMRQGEVYQKVNVRDEKGQLVDLPFLELHEELWDRTGTRLTLLIDPGRIKRGVKPLEDGGPVFEAGKKYILEIDGSWKDANDQELKESIRKEYTIIPAIRERIDPERWDISAPKVISDPLRITFKTPLDIELSQRCIQVLDRNGLLVKGKVNIERDGLLWQFNPEQPWKTGEYTLRVDPALEDLAGNRIDRVFDRDESIPDLNPKKAIFVRHFEIKLPK